LALHDDHRVRVAIEVSVPRAEIHRRISFVMGGADALIFTGESAELTCDS